MLIKKEIDNKTFYLINNEEEFVNYLLDTSYEYYSTENNYLLTRHLDLKDIPKELRKPINNFKGIFDGNNFTIFNFNIEYDNINGYNIGLFNYKDWLPTKDNLKIFEKFREYNIFFDNTEDLTKFINKNWENIDLWWNDIQKKKIIDQYINIFQKDPDYLSQWKNFLKNIR